MKGMNLNTAIVSASALTFITAVSPVWALEVIGRFADYSQTDPGFGGPVIVEYGIEGSNHYFLRFGSIPASTTYFFDTKDNVYRILKCGYKCNPNIGIVHDHSAKGRCQTRKLETGNFNISCQAVDSEDQKHQDTLLNAVREIHQR